MFAYIRLKNLLKNKGQVRVVLRNTLALAMEAEEAGEIVHLTEIYSNGCSHLLRLLRTERTDQCRLKDFLWEKSNLAIVEALKQWG